MSKTKIENQELVLKVEALESEQHKKNTLHSSQVSIGASAPTLMASSTTVTDQLDQTMIKEYETEIQELKKQNQKQLEQFNYLMNLMKIKQDQFNARPVSPAAAVKQPVDAAIVEKYVAQISYMTKLLQNFSKKAATAAAPVVAKPPATDTALLKKYTSQISYMTKLLQNFSKTSDTKMASALNEKSTSAQNGGNNEKKLMSQVAYMTKLL